MCVSVLICSSSHMFGLYWYSGSLKPRALCSTHTHTDTHTKWTNWWMCSDTSRSKKRPKQKQNKPTTDDRKWEAKKTTLFQLQFSNQSSLCASMFHLYRCLLTSSSDQEAVQVTPDSPFAVSFLPPSSYGRITLPHRTLAVALRSRNLAS